MCIDLYGAVLHHNLDKVYLRGGHARTDLGEHEMTEPAVLVVGGLTMAQSGQAGRERAYRVRMEFSSPRNAAGRAAFQVLVFPYRLDGADGVAYALFRRADGGYWQGVAGGGEDGESPLDAAGREAAEEAGIARDAEFVALDSVATIPVVNVAGDFRWGPDVLVIPEHAFGVRCDHPGLTVSEEHTGYGWFAYEDAMKELRWDSNRNALWELNHRLLCGSQQPVA